MSAEPIRVLVVDDELGMREGCRRILEPEGYEVETAEDGLAGLELFRKRRDFAVVLVDLKMPRMGGLELIEEVRALDEDPALLVVTAYATIETAVEATKRGAYGYVPKPFTPDELLVHVRNGVEKRGLLLEAKRLREERERRLLEVAYERSKSSTIINCMTDGVLVVNRDGRVVLRNPAAARIIPGLERASLAAPLDIAVGCAELKGLLAEAMNVDTRRMIASEEIVLGDCTYMVNSSPVTDPAGGTLGAVAVLRDITALKKLETAKSMFVSMVAHEVSRPLGVIESYLNLILSDAVETDAERAKQMMRRARSRAQGLRQMVSDLTDLAVIERGKFMLRRQPLDIGHVLAEAVRSCREKAEEKQIHLSLRGEEGASRVQALIVPLH